ncbi:MAG: acylneuraminate cytidylyltransferase family protein, partial [Thermoleophilaceae bacterium]
SLAGHPLIAYTLAAAHQSGLFDAVVVSTDSEEIARVAREYGGEVPALRPESMAGTTSPDIEWVEHTLALLADEGRTFELFSILRPTSPFRTEATIRRAWDQLHAHGDAADSIRAVERCRQHPGKMWVLEGDLMRPLLDQSGDGVPTHSRQYQDLPPVYAQNSSLEIAWTRVVTEQRDIAGTRVAPFLTEGAEGFTIDYPDDWEQAERWAASGDAPLPDVAVSERAGGR